MTHLQPKAGKTICTMCGKTLSEGDVNLGDNCYDIFVNYPSNHDCERIRLNFCVECFDRVLDLILPLRKIDPVVDDDWLEHCCEGGVIYRDRGPGGAAYRKKEN